MYPSSFTDREFTYFDPELIPGNPYEWELRKKVTFRNLPLMTQLVDGSRDLWMGPFSLPTHYHTPLREGKVKMRIKWAKSG